MMRTLVPKYCATVRAPSPVVEMSQLVVSNLGSCGLFWRWPCSLWENLFFTTVLMFTRSCITASGTRNISLCLTIASREPRNHLTALHSGVSMKDRAYGLAGVNHRAGR